MINEFRKKKLKLRPVTYLSGSQGSGNDIPHGYIWSPHLVPKPKGLPYLLARAGSYAIYFVIFSHISSQSMWVLILTFDFFLFISLVEVINLLDQHPPTNEQLF
jgi:hypothetical protein